MLSGGAKVGRWQPVKGGRHAFGRKERNVEPGITVRALCGFEVNSDELQTIAGDIAWIREDTCMECWKELAIRDY